MGRYSDSDNDSQSKRRRRRSRSKSSEASYSSSRSKHKKSKKSKKAKKRSVSRDRRSRSRDKRSRSRDRRSRSRDRDRYSRYKSPSRDRRSRSRSRSRDRRSRSRSYTKSRRSRSRSRGRYRRSRSRSLSKSRSGRSRRSSRSKSRSKSKVKEEPPKPKEDPCASIPGFKDMDPSEQAEIRLQMALKAAAAADEKLKEQGVLGSASVSNNSLPVTFEEQRSRSKALQDIEDDDFNPVAFMSSKNHKAEKNDINDSAHASAIFGGEEIMIKSEASAECRTSEMLSLMHPNLYVNPDEKMDRWVQKLRTMQKKKLEGEAY